MFNIGETRVPLKTAQMAPISNGDSVKVVGVDQAGLFQALGNNLIVLVALLEFCDNVLGDQGR